MGLLSTKVSINCGSSWATPIKVKSRSNLRSKVHKVGKKVLLEKTGWIQESLRFQSKKLARE